MTALLGLGTRESESVSTLSDDDLYALYENRLNAEQRAIALKILANDSDTYRRWLVLVESSEQPETLGANSVTPLAEQRAKKERTTQRWRPSFALPLGAVAAAVAAVMIFLPTVSNVESEITGLYRDFGAEAKTLLSSSASLPTRSLEGQKEDSVYTAAKTAVASGILAGLNEVGDNAVIPGVDVSRQKFSDMSLLEKQDGSALINIGRLAVLTHAQCQQGGSQEYFRKAQSTFVNILDSLATSNHDVMVGSKMIYEQAMTSANGKAQLDMCALSKNLLGHFAVR